MCIRDSLTGEKRDRAGVASPKDRGAGTAEPHVAQAVTAAAQPDRPAFFVQHPERHPADVYKRQTRYSVSMMPL